LLDSRSALLLALAAILVPAVIIWDALKNDHKSDLGSQLRRMLCDHGWHRRRGGTVRRRGKGYIARCRGCGVMLHRETRSSTWRTVTDEAEAAALLKKHAPETGEAKQG
jgi:hypothetical protein